MAGLFLYQEDGDAMAMKTRTSLHPSAAKASLSPTRGVEELSGCARYLSPPPANAGLAHHHLAAGVESDRGHPTMRLACKRRRRGVAARCSGAPHVPPNVPLGEPTASGSAGRGGEGYVNDPNKTLPLNSCGATRDNSVALILKRPRVLAHLQTEATTTNDVLCRLALWLSRIFKVTASACRTPWMCPLASAIPRIGHPTHGYEPTREAAHAQHSESGG